MNRPFNQERTPPSVAISASATELVIGGTVVFTVVIANPGTLPLEQAVLHDMLPAGLSFAANSVTVRGEAAPGADPADGIPIGLIAPNSSVSVTFKATADREPQNLIAVNTADLSFEYVTLDGGREPSAAQSNSVTLMIHEEEE